MHKIDGPGHLNNTFVSEIPSIGRAPTLVTPEWLNSVQGELADVITGAGIALNKNDNGQLNKALAALQRQQTYTAFSTAGVPPNFTLTANPAISAYAAGLRLRLKFNAAGNGADTINVNALGAKSLKQYDATGAKVAAVIAAGQLVDVEYDGVDFVLLDPLPAGGTDTELLLPGADASVGPLPVGAVMPVNGVLNTTAVTLKKGIYIYDCYGWSTQLGGGGTVGGGFMQQPVAITGIINASDTWRRINGETVNGKFYTGVLKVLTPTAQVVMQYRSYLGSTFTVPGPNSEYVSFYRIR